MGGEARHKCILGMNAKRMSKIFFDKLQNTPTKCSFCHKYVWKFNMASHYMTKHHNVPQENETFKKARAADEKVMKAKKTFQNETTAKLKKEMAGKKKSRN